MLAIATTQAILYLSLHNMQVERLLWLHPDFRSSCSKTDPCAHPPLGQVEVVGCIEEGTAGLVAFDAGLSQASQVAEQRSTAEEHAGGCTCVVASAFTARLSLVGVDLFPCRLLPFAQQRQPQQQYAPILAPEANREGERIGEVASVFAKQAPPPDSILAAPRWYAEQEVEGGGGSKSATTGGKSGGNVRRESLDAIKRASGVTTHQPLTFHTKIKSSGYTQPPAALRAPTRSASSSSSSASRKACKGQAGGGQGIGMAERREGIVERKAFPGGSKPPTIRQPAVDDCSPQHSGPCSSSTPLNSLGLLLRVPVKPGLKLHKR